MKTQLSAFIRWLVSLMYSFISSPHRVRLVLTVLVISVMVAALLLPNLISLAGNMGPNGG